MPLNVRRFNSSILLVLLGFTAFINAQTPEASPQNGAQPSPAPPPAAAPIKTQTAGEIMRDRISKAKAFIAVRNYNAAIYELENIRRETSDASVQAVTNILLTNTYLEQGNYKKAQDFLSEFYKHFKANNANASMYYSAVAGQVIKGARNQIDRYRALGLSVSDRNLPLEAVNDIEKMRETLELVITQAKEAGLDKNRSVVAMPLLEEATAARSSLGRDDYDAKRWRDEAAESREQMASSRSVIINAVDGTTVPSVVVQPPAPQTLVPQPNTAPTNSNVAANVPIVAPQKTPVVETNNKPSDTLVASNNNTPAVVDPAPKTVEKKDEPRTLRIVGNPPKKEDAPAQSQSEPAKTETKAGDTVDIGSLIAYAVKQTQPVYPSAARSMRAAGVVKVEVVIDEKGDVAEVQKASGHTLLQAAAKDAIRKWKFRPFVRDGQPVKATGFVNFNFSM